MALLLFILGCGVSEPSPPFEGEVDVYGIVRGWDGTGDVAVEACGQGTLVDEEGGFVTRVDSSCALRVVWETADHRARGPWHPLDATGPEVRVVLEMPEPRHLRRLSAEAMREKEGYIRSAQRQLDAEPPSEATPEPSRDY